MIVTVSSAQTETEYGSWSVEEHPIRIDYSVRVLEEISALSIEGLYRFRHGGVEVGGILYGHASDRVVQILGYLPLACEHAFGPRFVLSDRDRALFRKLIEAPGHEPALAGLATVGWYHSHTRSPVCLSPRDLEIHERYFPFHWQVALVLRPENYAVSRAGFFVKEPDHSIRETSYAEFPVRAYRSERTEMEEPAPEPVVAEHATPGEDSSGDAAAALEEEETETQSEVVPDYGAEAEEEPVPAEQAEDLLPSFARAVPQRRWRKWALIALAVCAAGGAVGVEEYYRLSAPQQPLSLWVADVGGQLLIEWDRASRPVKRAESGVLEIQDGKENVRIQIDADHLREGSIDYVRHSEIVDVRLKINQPGRGTAQEFIRFVGQPVRRPDDPDTLALKAEIERLRADVAAKDEQLARRRGARRR